MQDASRKKRVRYGESSPQAKLTRLQAQQIIDQHESGRKHSEIAAEFGIVEKHVWQIASGTRWASLNRRSSRLPAAKKDAQ